MLAIYLVLYALAVFCFAIYAFRGDVVTRVNLLGLGVFFWALVPFLQTLQKL